MISSATSKVGTTLFAVLFTRSVADEFASVCAFAADESESDTSSDFAPLALVLPSPRVIRQADVWQYGPVQLRPVVQ